MAPTSNSTQTAPSTLSSSSPKPQLKYEVFLSFKGKDTRNSFTDHLYYALVEKGIKTFRDDEELETGRPIKLELLDAIEKSRMAVIILSENYASSTWCLEELAKIVECTKKQEMRVLPVFYHVHPSDVRHQRGTFGDAFFKHGERFKENIEMVEKWRAALREVANLSGLPLMDGSESNFIKEIVEKIHDLNDTTLSVDYKDGLVGIDSCVQEIMDLCMDHMLSDDSDDVRFVGICGMSGIGKTTFAQEVFERIHRQFDASSFLRDVKNRDLEESQDKLLRNMKLKSTIPRWDEAKGIKATSNRLRNKKVIIVLDDADEEKLGKLAGKCDWFGSGSRIIITSEDKGLLVKRCGEKNVYYAKNLNASDGLKLFCQEAFGKPHCEENLLDICNNFVSYVDGHPLALKILGSSMHDIPIGLWKAELEKLRESAQLPDNRIQTVLRMRRKGGDKVKSSSLSDSPNAPLAVQCGANLAYQKNMEDVKRTMAQSLTSYLDHLYLNRNSWKEPIYHDKVRGTGSSYEVDPHPHNRTGPLDHYIDYNLIPGIFNHCFPQSEIPQWFCHQRKGHSVTIDIPKYLYNDPGWMGFAICAVFPFHKHPTAVRGNLDSKFRCSVMCLLETDFGCMSPLLDHIISEDEVSMSLYRESFLWVSFTPRGKLSRDWSQSSWVKFSFRSNSPDVSSALECGVNLVYERNKEEFTRTMVQLMTSYVDYLHLIRKSCKKKEPTVDKLWPMSHENVPRPDSSYEEDPGPRRMPIQPIPPEHTSLGVGTPKPFYQTGPLDFNPLFLYNNCFPPSKVTQEWFGHPSPGHSVTIDIPPNVYNDNNWMGFALFVCFSMGGDLETFQENMISEIPHFLYCQFRPSVGGLGDEFTITCHTSKAEIMWLNNQGGFIWISYIPGEPFKNMLRQCSRIEASFVSDWPGVMVQECGLRPLYQHDQLQFQQKLKQCNTLISEYSDYAHQFMVDQEKSNKTQKPPDEAARPSMVPYNSIDDFHRHLIYNSCFPQSEILDWFNHPSDGPKVRIPLPQNLYSDTTWTGFAMFASFSVFVGSLDSLLYCRFSFESQNSTFDIGRPHSYCLHKDDLCLLNLDGFMWLVYLPREWFPKWLNRCSFIEAEISDCSGLTVHKCGLHLLYQNDEEFFKEILFKTHLYNKYANEAKARRSKS